MRQALTLRSQLLVAISSWPISRAGAVRRRRRPARAAEPAALLMSAAEVGAVGTVATAMTTAPPVSEAILTAIALIIAVRSGILLRLSAARNECGQATDLLSAFMSTVTRLLVGRLLMLRRTFVHLLVARREGLCVARQIRLLLRFARRVARFILAHEGLGIVIALVKTLVGALLLSARRSLLLWLLIVVGILLAELFLRRGDKAEIMFRMLIVILGGDRIAGSLCVARELNIFFRNVRSSAADFDVRPV